MVYDIAGMIESMAVDDWERETIPHLLHHFLYKGTMFRHPASVKMIEMLYSIHYDVQSTLSN